jgi:hypothetical protein
MEWEWVDSRLMTREEELFKHFFESLPTDGDWTVVQPPDAPGLENQSSAARRATWLAVIDPIVGAIPIPDESNFAALPDEVVSLIKKDVDRSCPEFSVLNFKNRLDILLKRYAVRNQTVGYCQGLSFIGTALLQEDFSDREAFRVFVYLVEHVVSDFFVPSLCGLHQAVTQIKNILARKHPDILTTFERLELPLLWLAVEPLMTLWSRKFPLFAIRQIWSFLISANFRTHSSAVVALFVSMLVACKEEFLETRKNMEIVVAVNKRMQTIAADVKALNDVIASSKKIIDH